MRVSAQSHTLAVLRILVGLTQKQMADVLHCSPPTIQAIELGRLKLSEKLAGLASLKTGINLAWLLNDDVTQPPLDIKGQPYTKATFEQFQAVTRFRTKDPGHEHEIAKYYRETMALRLSALILRAYINDQTDLCGYKLSKAFDELEKQFHVTEADRKALAPPKRTPKYEAEVKKDERLVWWEFYSRLYDVLDQEEKKKIAARKLAHKPVAELKEGDVEFLDVDDAGQTIIKYFTKKQPSASSPKSKKQK